MLLLSLLLPCMLVLRMILPSMLMHRTTNSEQFAKVKSCFACSCFARLCFSCFFACLSYVHIIHIHIFACSCFAKSCLSCYCFVGLCFTCSSFACPCPFLSRSRSVKSLVNIVFFDWYNFHSRACTRNFRLSHAQNHRLDDYASGSLCCPRRYPSAQVWRLHGLALSGRLRLHTGSPMLWLLRDLRAQERYSKRVYGLTIEMHMPRTFRTY